MTGARGTTGSRGTTAGRDDRSRRYKSIGVAVAAMVAVAGLVAVAYLTPLMSVRSVDVTGLHSVDHKEVLRVAEVPEGKPLLRVDTAGIADRVSVLPAVESVRVVVHYPSTVTIEVLERTPLVRVDRDGRVGVMDRLGMVYLTVDSVKDLPKELRGLPELKTDAPASPNPTTEAALEVIGGLPNWLRPRVTEISADSPSSIRLTLGSGRTAVWGDARRTGDKAEALRHLLKLQGSEYNVSSPEFASIR